MKKTILYFGAFMILFSISMNAQTPIWKWARGAGGGDDDRGFSVCNDTFGNVYITGVYTTAITFGNNTLTDAGSGDIFIVKYDDAGNVVWAKRAGGANTDIAYDITTDVSGNIYITGYFLSETIAFDTITLTNTGDLDFFIAKYNSAGNLLWANNANGVSMDIGISISTDESGSVYVTGYFASSTITMGPDTLTNAGNYDYFIAKYNDAGNVLWAKSGGGTAGDGGNSICTDNVGNVYVAGLFSSPTITIGTTTLTNAGGNDFFVVKYDSDGNVKWAKNAGGNSDDAGRSVCTDMNGNIYVTGYYLSPTITFGSTTLVNAGEYDFFVVKYDTTGNVLWAKGGGGISADDGYDADTDSEGNIYVTGYYLSPTITFGSTTLVNAGEYDIIIIKYDSIGNVIWATSAGGIFSDLGSGISISKGMTDNVNIVGIYDSFTITFGTNTLTNANFATHDIFIATMCQPPPVTISTSGSILFCQGDSVILTASPASTYSWNNGATTQSIIVTTSGNYNVMIIGSNNCSAISTPIHVQVIPMPIVTLTLDPDIVCINAHPYALSGGLPIGGIYSGLGVSGGDFDPSAAGLGLHDIIFSFTSYIGGNECFNSDTSQLLVESCYGIEIDSEENEKNFIYPNPANELITIKTSINRPDEMISIFNIQGQLLIQRPKEKLETEIDISSLSKGLYFIKLTTPKGSVVRKFVKE